MGCCQVLQSPEFGGAGSWDRVEGVAVPEAGVRAFSAAIEPTDSRSVGVRGFASESLGARKLVGAFLAGVYVRLRDRPKVSRPRATRLQTHRPMCCGQSEQQPELPETARHHEPSARPRHPVH